MRRFAFSILLPLVVTLSLVSPVAARPEASTTDPCNVLAYITEYPQHVAMGENVTVRWQIGGTGFSTIGHNHVHWDWICIDGTRHSHETPNQPGPLGAYQVTLDDLPPEDGYIEFWVHASTGFCGVSTSRRQITVGNPPPRTHRVRLPFLGATCGRLFVSSPVLTDAQGLADLTLPGGQVRALVLNGATQQPLAGMSVVAAARDNRFLVIATDRDLHYVPQYSEQTCAPNGVTYATLGMMPILPGQPVYPATVPRPALLSNFSESSSCLTTSLLNGLAQPRTAAYLMLPSLGPTVAVLGGVTDAETTELAIRTLWCNLQAPHPAAARVWAHPGLPLTFVELVAACQPPVPVCP